MDPSKEATAETDADHYHPDEQIHAAYLLTPRPRNVQLARRVKRMYRRSGYDLSLHVHREEMH